MEVIRRHMDLPSAIETAEQGSTVLVTAIVLRELGEIAAARMGRGDLKFEVSDVPALRYEPGGGKVMGDWRPIETAPKNGRYILGWIDGDIVRICWGAEKLDNSGYWFCAHYFEPEPTHWMPCPPPPKEPK